MHSIPAKKGTKESMYAIAMLDRTLNTERRNLVGQERQPRMNTIVGREVSMTITGARHSHGGAVHHST